MAIDKHGIPFHPSEYNPDYPRIKCKICGLMNGANTDLQMLFWVSRTTNTIGGLCGTKHR